MGRMDMMKHTSEDALGYSSGGGWTFLLGTLSPIALFATPWFGPLLGIAAIITGIIAGKKPLVGMDKSLITLGMAFGIASVVLCWISPGLIHILWG